MLALIYHRGYTCQHIVAQLNLVVKYFPKVSETPYTTAPFTLTLSSSRANHIYSRFCLSVDIDSISCQTWSVEEADVDRVTLIMMTCSRPSLICLFCNRKRSTSCTRGSSMEILTQTATSRKRKSLETQGMQVMRPNRETLHTECHLLMIPDTLFGLNT